MYRGLIILFFLLLNSNAEKIEINAKIFEGNKSAKEGVFKDNVVVKQGDSFLNSDSLKIKINDKNKIISYIAKNVNNFSISMQDKNFKGKADLITYNVSKKIYELSGNVQIKEGSKEVIADYIILDQNTGVYKIESTKEKMPVRIIFEMEK